MFLREPLNNADLSAIATGKSPPLLKIGDFTGISLLILSAGGLFGLRQTHYAP
jgi:hypothetical protein